MRTVESEGGVGKSARCRGDQAVGSTRQYTLATRVSEDRPPGAIPSVTERSDLTTGNSPAVVSQKRGLPSCGGRLLRDT